MLIVITEAQAKMFKEAGITVLLRPTIDTDQFKPEQLYPQNRPEDASGADLPKSLLVRHPLAPEGLRRSATLEDWREWAERGAGLDPPERTPKLPANGHVPKSFSNRNTLVKVTRQGTSYKRMSATTLLTWADKSFRGNPGTATYAAYLVMEEFFEDCPQSVAPRRLLVKALRQKLKRYHHVYQSYQLSMLTRDGYLRLAR